MLSGVLAGLIAYLLGSIPFGYLLYRFRQGNDIRSIGSGNIGATNVFRAAGFLTGAATFLLDAGKGYAAVVIAGWLTRSSNLAIAFAIVLVMVGHCFPVFLGFRGGKAVATGLGAFLAISPSAVVVCMILFAVVLAALRYVSLASIIAAGVYPIVLALAGEPSTPILLASVAGSGLIIIRHRDNIQRLMVGTEPAAFGRRDF